MTALEALSDAGSRQVLLSVRVSDAITGRGIADAGVALAYDPSGSGAFLALPARLARRADGWFAYAIDPEAVPAPSGPSPALRVTAEAAAHQGATRTVSVDPDDLGLVQDTRTVAGHTVTSSRIDGAPFHVGIALDPAPIALEGTVYVEGDPEQPAEGATVEVVAPPGRSTTTDERGAFRITDVPVAGVVSLRITHGSTTADRSFRPDYRQRVNRAVFATD